MFVQTLGNPTALDTTWKKCDLGAGGDTPPKRYMIQNVTISFVDIVGATSVTVAVTHDEEGVKGVSPATPSGATQTITQLGVLGATGYVAINIGGFWIQETDESPVVWAKLNAGTATGSTKLFGTTEGQP